MVSIRVEQNAMSRSALRFGEARRLPGTPAVERALFGAIGIADPAHWLHFKYLENCLDLWTDFTPRRILDAGCGRGDYSFYLARRWPNADVLGIDIDLARIERCRRLGRELGLTNLRFDVSDLAVSRLGDAFDLVVSIDVLEHIVTQREAIENLGVHLAPGGRFFFHIPTVRETPVIFSDALHSFSAWAEHEHVAQDRTAAEFVELVEACGLRVEACQRTFGRYTGELAVSLFTLPHRNTLANKALQALLALPCRAAAWADMLSLDRTRYAVALRGRKR